MLYIHQFTFFMNVYHQQQFLNIHYDLKIYMNIDLLSVYHFELPIIIQDVCLELR